MGRTLSTDTVVKTARRNRLRVVQGKGDHIKIYDRSGGHLSINTKRELSPGLASKARKWFAALGIVLVLVVACIATAYLAPAPPAQAAPVYSVHFPLVVAGP